MTNLNFPSNPELGQIYKSSKGQLYWWDGVKWAVKQPVAVEPTPAPIVEPTPAPIVDETPVLFASAFMPMSNMGGIDFPPSPTVGYEFKANTGITYIFDGVKWVINQNVVVDSNNNSNAAYVLPVATNIRLGGVRIGTGIINQNGTISIDTTGSLKGDPGAVGAPGPQGPSGPQGPAGISGEIATASTAGTVKIGANVNISQDGAISVPVATNSTLGVVKPGTNIAIDGTGALSVPTGAGINTLESIANVNPSGIRDGSLLVYNQTASRWDVTVDLIKENWDSGQY